MIRFQKLRYLLWGLSLFLFDMFVMYQIYSKNFQNDAGFLINLNQIVSFVLGLLYSNRYRKIEPMAIFVNALVFSILSNYLFYVFECYVDAWMLFGTLAFIFVNMFVGHYLYWFLFCPKNNYKRVKTVKKYGRI